MTNSTTMTIRVTPEVKDRLGRLAHDTRRSRSFLAAEAVVDYLDREQSIIDGIKHGLADVAAGRTVPHDVVMGKVDAAIARVKASLG